MLSFVQFILETYSRPKVRVGWLRHDGKAPVHANGDHTIHADLAYKHQLSHPDDKDKDGSFVGHTKSAVNRGNVRFWHKGGEEASYEYKDTPKNREAVADHLSKSGHFKKVVFDKMHPKTGKPSGWHRTDNTKDAVNHLLFTK